MIALNPQFTALSERSKFSQSYLNAKPFQHVVIDNLFAPEVLDSVIADFERVRHNKSYGDSMTQKKHTCDDWNRFPPSTFEMVSFLNSGPFITFLREITGIASLTSDPFLLGGGLHETMPGGYLKMHTDFNFHKQIELDRRVNAILFLNRDWHPTWGGELILTDTQMTQTVSVPPLFNRLVIFNTNDHSFHGQPDPHNFPEGNSRKSIAMYYYSNGRPTHEISSQKIGTTYKARYSGDLPFMERLKEAARLLMGSKGVR